MIKKVKEAIASKKVRMATVLTLALSMLVCAASAVDGENTTAIVTAFSSGFQSIVTDSIALLSAMLPIALSLCAVLFLVKKAMGWFRSIAK